MSGPSYAAIALHLDSIAQAADYPLGFVDPTYRQVMDRFLDLAARFGFRYSMYAVGRDLEDPAACDRLRALAADGHEIGNHTWNHFTDFGALPEAGMRREIVATHTRIREAIGRNASGFVAPGWSYSKRVTPLLQQLGYRYDMSLFPSLLYYPFVAKNALNHIGHREKLWRVMNRRDYLQPFLASREPFEENGIRMFPMPVTPGAFGMAVWHTTGFMLGWERHYAMLSSAMRARRFFYYVVHPADLTCDEDLRRAGHLHLERAGGSLAPKVRWLAESLMRIADSGHEWVTMGEMTDALAGVQLAST